MTFPRDATATVGALSLHYLDWGTRVCRRSFVFTASHRPRTAGTRWRPRSRARTTFAPSTSGVTATRRGHPTATIASRRKTATSRRFSRRVDAAPAVLVALSMGGLVALTLAARAPRARPRARRRRHRARGATRRRRQHPELRRRDRRARHFRGVRRARSRLQSAPFDREHPRAPAPQSEAAAERTVDLEVRPTAPQSCARRRGHGRSLAARSRRFVAPC